MKPETVKVGRGIELTLEALIEIIHQRLPDLLPWEDLERLGSPDVDYDPTYQRFGLYWTGRVAWDDPVEFTDHQNAVRRVGQGAPIPSFYISTGHVLTESYAPRCPEGVAYHGDQCILEVDHTSDHVYEFPAKTDNQPAATLG